MITSKYFNEGEFKACSPSCSLENMNQDFINKLDEAREIAGIPFVLNSAYRSSAHDKRKGRSGTGAHTLGVAVDIRCVNSAYRFKIINALLAVGFSRIGVSSSFIHVDGSKKHAQDVVWTY